MNTSHARASDRAESPPGANRVRFLLREARSVQAPVEAVTAIMEAGPEAWLPLASWWPLELDLRAGSRVPLRRRVRVSVGTPIHVQTGIRIPITWRAVSLAPLFPVLEGEIEVNRLEVLSTELVIRAAYEPPLGAFGRTLDRTLLFRVGRASVRHFLDAVTERVEDELDHRPRFGRSWGFRGSAV
ncbi:MAG: hypothetical protein ACYDAY_06475 [Candidatus Dormibacteria bacterium]